jgi:hypothetical protein
MKFAIALPVALLWMLAWPTPGAETISGEAAAASTDGLSRCTSADGVTLFTDQRCEDLQAVDQHRPPPPPVRPVVLVRVRSCARNQDDFLFGVRTALENRDVNRLADFYHWTGMGTKEGYRLMDRLSAFSALPLVDVQLVSSRQLDESALPEPAQNPDPYAADSDPSVTPEPTEPEQAAPRAAHPADLLRVDQMVSATDLATRATYFHLRSNAGCWWMQF